MTRDPALAAVWSAGSSREARSLYDDWAASYDAENLGKGMRHPFVGAALAARHIPPGTTPILDAACGTGLVGELLHVLGFRQIVGCDLSPEMIARAARYGAYEGFCGADLTALPFADGTFGAFTCVGAFGPGHAPPASLRELARVTRPGGIGVFSLREDTFRDQGFEDEIAAIGAERIWTERYRSDAFRAYLIGEPQLYARMVVVEIAERAERV